eukprot:TRINITY_DN20237_c1_g1_i1.p1 TRINITY_DN20237_c1_g1~~TRINITY_DN20237_c1_g1_i1.p1  ORF type:complete len:119 (-),score=6.20 TRINITY_DN20237_c1_g1_i1:193-549(-)
MPLALLEDTQCGNHKVESSGDFTYQYGKRKFNPAANITLLDYFPVQRVRMRSNSSGLAKGRPQCADSMGIHGKFQCTWLLVNLIHLSFFNNHKNNLQNNPYKYLIQSAIHPNQNLKQK